MSAPGLQPSTSRRVRRGLGAVVSAGVLLALLPGMAPSVAQEQERGTTPPTVAITKSPKQFSVALREQIRFESDDPEATHYCTLDDVQEVCAPPTYETPKLEPGVHIFSAEAHNEFGPGNPKTVYWTTPMDDDVFTASTKWKRHKSKKAYGGSYLETEKKGASLSYPFDGASAIALVASTGKNMGTVKILIGKKTVGVFSLKSNKARTKRVFVVQFDEFRAGDAAEKLRVKSTSKKPVRIEGLGVELFLK